MKTNILNFIILYYLSGLLTFTHAQCRFYNPPVRNYNATPARVNDLVHTKLEVKFDIPNNYLYGKEWVTIKPHIYSTDSLVLDAKGMDIHNVSLFKNGILVPLKYRYDNLCLEIKLDKSYKRDELYTIYIDYTSKPSELKGRKKNEKGLYFIHPDETDKTKPIQIWTEGEIENSSIWFPTIDKPNQKSTQEINMTVPDKYVTLSNGKLISKKVNSDGTRTDCWKMDVPNSPYLFMMAVGDFKIYKDSWRGKEVSYYLEPAYASYAKAIFGETPEAIEFFSKTLAVDYPWDKYAQIVVRDYVSGAMENTSATILGEPTQGTTKELTDRYNFTGIEHELFHQWFGDYVTTESWSNLTLNESMAVFGESIWLEHKYGKDASDAFNLKALQSYLNNTDGRNKNLVRFDYVNKQEVFDGVTYQKGSCIVNMLRNFLGNEAFYKGLNIYLTNNAYKSAEVHQLRLAFEEASGLDLNWFFNQWYFGAGHPEINISYKWNEKTKSQTVYLQQTQNEKAFILPVTIDFYVDNKKEHRLIWMTTKSDSLTCIFSKKPLLVNVDADKVLVASKTDNKPLTEFAFQYFNLPLFVDRYEALVEATGKQDEMEGQKILIAALNDKYWELRLKAINSLDMTNKTISIHSIPVLKELAEKDENNMVRASAISLLGKLKQAGNISLFEMSLKTESYAVQGASLTAIGLIDSIKGLKLAKLYENDNKKQISEAILFLYTTYGGNTQWSYIYDLFKSLIPARQFNIIQDFARLTGRIENPDFAMQGITAIKELGIKGKKYGLSEKIIELLIGIKTQRIKLNDGTALFAEQSILQINDPKE